MSISQEQQPSFVLDIGGVRIGFFAEGLSILPELLNRYHAFLSDDAPQWALHVELRTEDDLPREKPWIIHEGSFTTFQVDGYAGTMDLDTRQATVQVLNSRHAISGLERVAAYFCLQALPRYHDSLLIHGAGIIIDERGYIFFGASGQGKSTIAKLADGIGDVLSDELVIVEITEAGPLLHGTPFWGTGTSTERVAQTPYRPVPLRALYTLRHGSSFSTLDLSVGAGVMALLASEKVATERVSSSDYWLAMAEKVVRVVPVRQLKFYPSPKIWSYLTIDNGREFV